MIKAEVVSSSGSIARDLNLPNPEESDLKVSLIVQINRILQSANLTVSAAARAIGIEPGTLESVLEGDYADFTVYELMLYLKALGQDVEIVVRPAAAAHAHLCVLGQ